MAKTKTQKPSSAPKKRGRPLLRSLQLCEKIGERLGQGEPLTHICRDIGIDDRTVRKWMDEDPDIRAVIAHARAVGEDAIAHKCRDTARGKGDSTGDVQRDKLIIDTDLKLLAKWNPKRYGDKVQIGGANDLPPIQTTVKAGELSNATLTELMNARRKPDPTD